MQLFAQSHVDESDLEVPPVSTSDRRTPSNAARAYLHYSLSVHGDLALFADPDVSSDGSGEDAILTLALTTVPKQYGVLREQVLPRRLGAMDLSWVKQAQTDPNAITTASLETVIDGITTALNSGRFDIVDEALHHANLHAMSVEAILAYLRIPFMARHRLKEWNAFRERSRTELNSRGLPTDALLKGLG